MDDPGTAVQRGRGNRNYILEVFAKPRLLVPSLRRAIGGLWVVVPFKAAMALLSDIMMAKTSPGMILERQR